MPIYEYKCKKCGQKFEVRLGFFQNKKSVKCPICNDENPDRIFSSFMTGSSGSSTSVSNSSSCSSRKFS
jgi:putative FmdB family regulatory protein